jgi:hypothetical protein
MTPPMPPKTGQGHSGSQAVAVTGRVGLPLALSAFGAGRPVTGRVRDGNAGRAPRLPVGPSDAQKFTVLKLPRSPKTAGNFAPRGGGI